MIVKYYSIQDLSDLCEITRKGITFLDIRRTAKKNRPSYSFNYLQKLYFSHIKHLKNL